MTKEEIEEMALALSWARTFIDDPGEALSRQETIDVIDSALQAWHRSIDNE